MLRMKGFKGELSGNDKDSSSHEERRHQGRETSRGK
jgi:hypothetical protein